MKMNTLNKAIAAVLLTGVIASTANAAVLTDSYTNAFETTEIAQSGMLDLFDAANGTLNSATLTFTASSLSSSVLTNNSATPALFDFNSSLAFFFDASSVGIMVPLPALTTQLASTGGFTNLASGASVDGTTIATLTKSDSMTWSVTLSGADAAALIGSGEFATSCSTLSGTTFTGGGANIVNVQDTTAFCAADISYDFTAPVMPPVGVSSPATALLFGAGLLGLAGVGRAKRKS